MFISLNTDVHTSHMIMAVRTAVVLLFGQQGADEFFGFSQAVCDELVLAGQAWPVPN